LGFNFLFSVYGRNLFILKLNHARKVGENFFSVTVDVLIIEINVLTKCFMLNFDNRNCCYRHRRYKRTALYKQIIFVYYCKIKQFTWQRILTSTVMKITTIRQSIFLLMYCKNLIKIS